MEEYRFWNNFQPCEMYGGRSLLVALYVGGLLPAAVRAEVGQLAVAEALSQ